MTEKKKIAYRIKVDGLVQGVGFRPFIYRIAQNHHLKGWVDNRNDGVHIEVSGEQKSIEKFIEDINVKAPGASKILNIDIHPIPNEGFLEFKIVKSKDTSDDITEVSPDIAVCEECLLDMKRQENRINYPFINCTNCGPRFTIIKDLPYDRDKTTMDPFIMCEKCSDEYHDILDRRFHAQPVACSDCGPEYEMITSDGTFHNVDDIIKVTSNYLEDGKIVTIKGLGGFHIACDAQNEDAVAKLRNSKHREGKPFAVMYRDMESLKGYCIVEPREEKVLTSWKRPIVLLKQKKKLAESVKSSI